MLFLLSTLLLSTPAAAQDWGASGDFGATPPDGGGGGDDSGMVNIVDPVSQASLGSLWLRSGGKLENASFWFQTSDTARHNKLKNFDLVWVGEMSLCEGAAFLDVTGGPDWASYPVTLEEHQDPVVAPTSPKGLLNPLPTDKSYRAASYLLLDDDGQLLGRLMHDVKDGHHYHHFSWVDWKSTRRTLEDEQVVHAIYETSDVSRWSFWQEAEPGGWQSVSEGDRVAHAEDALSCP